VNFDDLRDQGQQRLIEFLLTDLDLGYTYVRMAQTRQEGGDRERLLQNARKVLETTRRFEGRIADAKAWTAIHEQADELERLIFAEVAQSAGTG
jgi:hypothetical protein